MGHPQRDQELAAKSLDEGIGKENEIYTSRFSESQDKTREITWRILCQQFFSRFLKPEYVVVDVGAGDGCFLRHIKARRRIAVDLSAHVRALEKSGIEVIQASGTAYADKLSEQPDIIFMSNFLEHLPTKRILLQVLEHAFQALKPGGKLIILQPNIRYVGAAYWDYIDHHIPLTEHSLSEGLEVTGFSVEELIPRFLPYTVRSKVGAVASGSSAELFVKIYLAFPLLWRIFGQQTFVVARKPA